jgi:hypothetical protein
MSGYYVCLGLRIAVQGTGRRLGKSKAESRSGILVRVIIHITSYVLPFVLTRKIPISIIPSFSWDAVRQFECLTQPC